MGKADDATIALGPDATNADDWETVRAVRIKLNFIIWLLWLRFGLWSGDWRLGDWLDLARLMVAFVLIITAQAPCQERSKSGLLLLLVHVLDKPVRILPKELTYVSPRQWFSDPWPWHQASPLSRALSLSEEREEGEIYHTQSYHYSVSDEWCRDQYLSLSMYEFDRKYKIELYNWNCWWNQQLVL